MVWREQDNNFDDCYFCLVNIKGISSHKWVYPNWESARTLFQHLEAIPVPIFSEVYYQSMIMEIRLMIMKTVTLKETKYTQQGLLR